MIRHSTTSGWAASYAFSVTGATKIAVNISTIPISHEEKMILLDRIERSFRINSDSLHR